ncbi:hypothetical protein BZM26_00580 [Paraburkholderia strydomiana]|nr:hypothetical protein BZM26_00580 [Paraburkholderia strydomiana]
MRAQLPVAADYCGAIMTSDELAYDAGDARLASSFSRVVGAKAAHGRRAGWPDFAIDDKHLGRKIAARFWTQP